MIGSPLYRECHHWWFILLSSQVITETGPGRADSQRCHPTRGDREGESHTPGPYSPEILTQREGAERSETEGVLAQP